MLEPFLADLESRIDIDTEDDLFAQWKEFAEGSFCGDIFSPQRRQCFPSPIEWPHIWVNDAIEDFELMALQQLSSCSAALEAGNGALLSVRCNYGTSILPSLFGAEPFWMAKETDTLPTSRPLTGGAEAIKQLLDRGVPSLVRSLGGRTLEMGARFVEIMDGYPKVARHVRLYHPDLQGPIDICEVLWGSSLFLDIVDQPDLVKAFLALITETYIQFMRAWTQIVPFSVGHAVHWGMLHRGHIMLREDSAMNLSPLMYSEFIEPCDQRLLNELGGGAVHFCGKGDHYLPRLSELKGVFAVNMTQPEYNDLEVIYRHTVDKRIQLLGLDRKVANRAIAGGRDLRGQVHSW